MPLFLIPYGPGQVLLPGNQLSQSLTSLSLHLLSYLPVASSQGSPSSPLRLSACSRVSVASGWQRWLEKPRPRCCFCLQCCSPVLLFSHHPLLVLQLIMEGPSFSENLYSPKKHWLIYVWVQILALLLALGKLLDLSGLHCHMTWEYPSRGCWKN